MDAHFVETYKVIPMHVPKDTTAGLTTEWVNMKNAHKATFILYAGVIGTGGPVTLGVANSASGTNSTFTAASMDLTLDKFWRSGVTAASSADVYTKVAVSSSTFTIGASSDNKIWIMEVDASRMGQFTSTSVYDAKYVALALTAGTDFYSCICILTGYRYQEDAPATDLG